MASPQFKKVTADDEVGRIICDEMTDEICRSFILVGEDDTCLPEYYLNFAESIRNFKVRNSDIIVASYPKTGTTWAQEMVWMIVNSLDFKGAETPLIARFPFLEACTISDRKKHEQITGTESPEFFYNSVEYTNKQVDPRFIKTHLPFSLLPDEIKNGFKIPKIIYVTRNPKDTCISYFHHGRLLQRWRPNLQNFCKVFLADKAHYGSFWKHVFGYWEHRNSPNLLIITYEDMKQDLPAVIRTVAKFLNKALTDEQVRLLSEHLSFESMKQNKALNAEELVEMRKKHNLVVEDGAFIRSGTVGKYRDEMTPEMIAEFDAWIKKNLEGTGFGQQYNYSL